MNEWMNEQMNLELNLTNIIHHLSPSPPSWSGWSCQCSWWSPLWSQSQNLCCLTFWYDFLKVNKANSTITSINLLSLSVFIMAKSIMIAKPKSMLYDLLVWFSEGLQPFVRLLSLILSRFVPLLPTNRHTRGLIGLLSQPKINLFVPLIYKGFLETMMYRTWKW